MNKEYIGGHPRRSSDIGIYYIYRQIQDFHCLFLFIHFFFSNSDSCRCLAQLSRVTVSPTVSCHCLAIVSALSVSPRQYCLLSFSPDICHFFLNLFTSLSPSRLSHLATPPLRPHLPYILKEHRGLLQNPVESVASDFKVGGFS